MPARETLPARSFGQVAGDWFGAAAEAMKIRNMWICVVVGILMVAHFVITWAFMPLFLVNARGMDETSMSYLMGSLGIAAAIYSFAVSGLSDKIGSKPVMVFLPFLSVVGALGLLIFDTGDIEDIHVACMSGYDVLIVSFFLLG